MKKLGYILIFLLSIAVFGGLKAQTNQTVFCNKGATVMIKNDINVLVNGDLENSRLGTNNGEILVKGSTGSNIHIKGDLINNATFKADTGIVYFNGSNAQKISGDSSVTFDGLVLNNSDGLTVETEPTITGTGTFTNGIATGPITFGENATAEARTTSFVDGIVTKKGTDNFLFPTGNVKEGIKQYAPLEAKPKTTTATNTSTKVRYKLGSNGMPDWWEHSGNMGSGEKKLDHVTDKEHWVVNSNDTLLDMKLYWYPDTAAHSFGESDDLQYLRIAYAKHAEGCHLWTNMGGALPSSYSKDTGNITVSSSNSINENATELPKTDEDSVVVTFASVKKPNLILPIELLSFTAECMGDGSVLVQWSTATETDNAYFELEKSADAKSFYPLTEMAGAGTSNNRNDYSFVDNNGLAANNYYRLRWVDNDGNISSSNIIFANCQTTTGELSLSVYPNPSDKTVDVAVTNVDEPFVLELVDNVGKILYSEQCYPTNSSHKLSIDLHNLQPAIYNLRLRSNTHTVNRQIVKL